MNFLEIAKSVRSEAGLSGNGPSSVSSQTGMDLKVVNWVNDSYYEIQSAKNTWRWMWRDNGLIATAVGQREYDLAGLGFDVNLIVVESIRVVKTGQPNTVARVQFVEYAEFREQTVFTARRDGQPLMATIDPSGAFQVDPVPNEAFQISFEYYISPAYMATNADVPIIPAKYQRVIVEKALMKYAAHDENITLFQDASANYKMWMRRLGKEQTLDATVADPMV